MSVETSKPSCAVQQASGFATRWDGPGWPGFANGQDHTFATREVLAAPTAHQLELDPSRAPWQAMRDASMAMLSDAALMAGCAAFEIRYVVTPVGSGPSRIRMFLTAKAYGRFSTAAEAAVEAACQKLPIGFQTGPPVAGPTFGQSGGQFDELIVELRCDEELTQPQWQYIPADFYYVLNDQPGDGSGWAGFWRSLVSASQPATVSLLFQQAELSWEERNVLGSLLTDLSRFSEPRTEYDLWNRPEVFPACMNAKLALASWSQRLDRLQRPLLSRLAVRADVSTAVTIATGLATAIASSQRADVGAAPMYYETPANPSDIRQANFGFDWLEMVPWGGHGIWSDDLAPTSLRRLPYLFGLQDAATLAVLPVPDVQGVAGMPRARMISAHREELTAGDTASSDGIFLGFALHHGTPSSPITLPLSAINRHLLIVGEPGSGKTTTVLSCLAQLWRSHRVPFLVIESVKTEYRSLLPADGFDELQVITLGNERIAPLRLNPLEPPPGVPSELHQSAALAALKLALPLGVPLPQLLSTALDLTFQAAGWRDETTIEDGIAPPTLRDLRRHFDVAFRLLGHRGQGRDIGPAFQARIDSLLRGYMGKMLDTQYSVGIEAMLNQPTIVEMNDIQDADERSLVAALILSRVRAFAKRRGSSATLRHVTVIEEAHRLLAKANLGRTSPDSGDNTRADSVAAFCEAIGEMRSVGEGFILSSQSPEALASAAVANTGTRIVHRMESSKDRDSVLDDMDASPQLRQIAARLTVGEAVTRWPARDEGEVVLVTPAPGVDSHKICANEVVAKRMAVYAAGVRTSLPYRLCSLEVCVAGCDSSIRQAGRSTARLIAKESDELWMDTTKTGEERAESIVKVAAQIAQSDLSQLVHCVCAHLEADGLAFSDPDTSTARRTLAKLTRRVVAR